MPRTGPTDDPLALERQVCFALAVASRTVISVYRPVLEPMGLTHPQYLVMLALWGREPLSVTELGRVLELDVGTLSRLLKRLESAGLVTRERNPADERSLAVGLTARGRDLREEALDVPVRVLERLGMDLDELVELRDRLTRVIDAAKDATRETMAPA
ncbi:MarR family transcriptional regulator [Nocardioides sp. Soil774]|uniref:MarR family winged helix-turn-helix transcriptional regulator n=1 Tax=Nocardioides sp. Soil774 TaxID=1736408 RepID=UPI0006FDBBA9|nr:MarR family transcriptional regulator [Nocardioides sp. Soil774]KRE95139.1 MarR family transcriptional regulator [Nocardioides sp. Soil774]